MNVHGAEMTQAGFDGKGGISTLAAPADGPLRTKAWQQPELARRGPWPLSASSPKSPARSGNWKPGREIEVEAEQTIMLIKSMKMEIPVMVATGGVLTSILVEEGQDITEGQEVATVEI